jgi:hypothetical protein
MLMLIVVDITSLFFLFMYQGMVHHVKVFIAPTTCYVLTYLLFKCFSVCFYKV